MEPSALIIESLNRIWNQKMVGAVYDTFTHTVQVHRSCRDDLYGQEAIMIDVVERLAAFPDLYLSIEDIIWVGSEEQGYRVSLRLKFTGRNLGVSRYGAASNQEIEQEILMHANIFNDRFVKLWIAEDERTLVSQMGFDLAEAVESLERMNATIGDSSSPDIPASMGELQTQEFTRLSLEELTVLKLKSGADVRTIISALWNGRQVGLCERFYADNFVCHWASNRHLEGRQAYQAVVLSQLAAFPDLTFFVDDVIEQQRKKDKHIALRWTMLGTHVGPSEYGQPSTKRVKITGISQYIIRNGRFVSERTEFNEFRLMQKIMQRTPEPAGNDSMESVEELSDE